MNPRATIRSRILRREATRFEILETAAAAIAEHGFHGMSMRDLARTTGWSLANFYNYFRSKEDLLFALQTHAFETLNATVETSLAGVDEPAARLYLFILNHLRYVGKHRAIMRVLVHEAAALPPKRRKIVRALKERYFRTGQRIVKEILKEGCRNAGARGAPGLDAREVARTTYSIFGMLNWTYGWYDPRRHGSPQDVARTIHGIVLCGLVAHCPYRQVQVEMENRVEALFHPPLLGSQLNDSGMV